MHFFFEKLKEDDEFTPIDESIWSAKSTKNDRMLLNDVLRRFVSHTLPERQARVSFDAFVRCVYLCDVLVRRLLARLFNGAFSNVKFLTVNTAARAD